MKKLATILALLLAAVMLFAACGPKNQPANADGDGMPDVSTTTPETTVDETTTGVDETTTGEGGSTTAQETTTEGTTIPLPQGKAEILAEYTRVVDAVKARQPTYTSIDYQNIINEKDLPAEVIEMLNTYFYKGGAKSLTPESIVDTRQLTKQQDARLDRREHKTGENGERLPGSKSNARWFCVSMNDKGCLAKESDVKSASIKNLGGDRRQIDIVIADARNPSAIKEGAAAAPNPIAAFMEVQDISEVFGYLENGLVRAAVSLLGISLKTSSYMQYANSTIRLVYDAKTMECESLYQVGKFTLYLDGSIKGTNCTGQPVKIDAIFDCSKFDWTKAWPA